jgi:hypothetical protein
MKFSYRAAFCAAVFLVPGLVTAGTISDWSKSDLVVGDKDFHLVSFKANNGSTDLTSALGSTQVTASNIVAKLFSLTLGNAQSAIVKAGPWTGELVYTVKITDPNFKFDIAALDSTAVGFKSVITEEITGAFTGSPQLLTSTNGSADLSSSLSPAIFLTIDEKFTISALSAITSVQNSFNQNPVVPEAGSLAGWVIGLIGIGSFHWAKRRKAKAAAI